MNGAFPQLEVQPLHRRRRLLHDLLAGRRVARQRDHVDVVVLADRRADLAARPGDDVQHPFRNAGLQRRLADLDGGQRRVRGRLQDDRVPGRQGRADLPGGHEVRVVPGRDRADDADRLAPDDARVAGRVLARGNAVEDPALRRHEADIVVGEGKIGIDRQLVRLAGLGGLHLGQALEILVEQVGHLIEVRRALPGGQPRPLLERLPGRLHGAIDVGGGPLRHAPDGLLVRGVDHRETLPGG